MLKMEDEEEIRKKKKIKGSKEIINLFLGADFDGTTHI